jgi:hypothetical protein
MKKTVFFAAAIVIAAIYGLASLKAATGLGWMQFVGESSFAFILLVVIGTVVGFLAGLVVSWLLSLFLGRRRWANWQEKIAERIMFIVAISVTTCMIGSHFWASTQLAPEKANFAQMAQTASAKIRWAAAFDSDGRALNKIDCGGRLDSVVAERDKKLEQMGFVCIGQWSIDEDKDVHLSAVYVPNPLSWLRPSDKDGEAAPHSQLAMRVTFF